jgi:hypothetical protein
VSVISRPRTWQKAATQRQPGRRRMAAQLVQFFGRDAPPVGQQNLGGEVDEQVGGQRERTDAGEFVGLLADTLQAGLTGARAQREQRSATDLAARCIGGGGLEQGVESGGCLRR